MNDLIIRSKDLCKVLGISRTTLWRFEKEPNFPQKIKLGENSVGYLRDDVVAWLEKNKISKTAV